jgi:hypothetical protein
LLSSISDLLTASMGDVDGVKASLAVSSAVLNVKNCTAAPVCSTLNRKQCTHTDHTCGGCLEGFVGTEVDANSFCISTSAVITNYLGDVLSCTSDADCPSSWDYCNNLVAESVAAGICVRRNKQCNHNCSNHGNCSYVLTHNGSPVETCVVGDPLCESLCTCEAGYTGTSCQMSDDEFDAKCLVRRQLLDGVQWLVASDETTEDTIVSWQSTLAAITTSRDELCGDCADRIFALVATILDTSTQTDVFYTSLGDSLTLIDDAVSSALTSGYTHNITAFYQLLDAFSIITAGDLVAGQNAYNTITDTFQMAQQTLSTADNKVTQTPLSASDISLGKASSICNVSSTNATSLNVVITTINARMYNGSDMFVSNVIRIRTIDEDSTREGALTYVVVIQHAVKQNYYTSQEVVYINTTCHEGDLFLFNHTCPGGPAGDLVWTGRCNGTDALVVTQCPNVTSAPTCHTIGSESYHCEVLSATPMATTCECVELVGGSKRRLSSVLQESGALEVVSVTTVVATEFVSTLSTAEDFNSLGDLRKTITVVLMYGIMWTVGVFGVMACSLRQVHAKINSQGMSKLAKKKAIAMSTKSRVAIRNYVTAYVDEIFPSVFQPTPGVVRLWHEISKHHRYLLMFTAKGKNADSVRILTCIHLLSVQSMLMFILAVCYDIEVSLHSTRTSALVYAN